MQKKNIKKQTVAVGMSGGVDSTMAAYLLKKQGFNVVGLTMKIWDRSVKIKHSKGCYGPESLKSIKDAKGAAQKIGIPHYVVDLTNEYKKNVLNYFKKEYSYGRTPNPCIICNYKIKFGDLLFTAKKSGIKFDKFATGHYARIYFDKQKNLYILKKGIDESKDQSYFIYRLTQSQLKNVIFPLGEYRKLEIKKLAKKLGYKDLADKPESQNFIGSDNYGVLFGNKFKPGNIVDTNGKTFGKHEGIIFYTIGQRRGLDIGGLKEPLYVIKINAKKNEVVVGPKKYLFGRKLFAKNLIWNADHIIGQKVKCQAKIRFGSSAVDCIAQIKNKNKIEVEFTKPQFAITPGQSVVFYVATLKTKSKAGKKDILLGGGIIV